MQTCCSHNEFPYIFVCKDSSKLCGFSYKLGSRCSLCSKEMPVTPTTYVMLNHMLINRKHILFKSDWYWFTSRDIHDKLDDINLDIDTSCWSSVRVFVAKYLKYMQEYYPDVVAKSII